MSLERVDGDGVTLLRLPTGTTLEAVADGYGGHLAGRGWPHEDTAAALAFAGPGAATFLVVDPDGAVIGDVGTKAGPDETGAVEIGYGLAGPSRGRGLGTRAVAALLGWLDADPQVRRVAACVQPDNVASRRLLERLGFVAVSISGPGEVRYERSADLR